MQNTQTHEVTQLLLAWNAGEGTALERLIPLVYEELRRMARRYMRQERVGHTLQATALINEAYVRLIDAQAVQWQNRAQFFGIAAQLMRRILVDFARERGYQKRGGGAQQVSLEEAMVLGAGQDENFVALDEALSALAKLDERKCRIVEMRFFARLTEEEIAGALGLSEKTVRRDWRFAKTWLRRYLTEEAASE
ncbi:MAG: sigma-70 family RNA polymerase sigma factor [Blastocatellia bacterium]|nr:sigma-70 family RNA polymerase sigma factor [Blastocatellia bacterium]